jgi:hypothetical protein
VVNAVMFGLGVPEVVIHRDPVLTAFSWSIASCYIQFRSWEFQGAIYYNTSLTVKKKKKN